MPRRSKAKVAISEMAMNLESQFSSANRISDDFKIASVLINLTQMWAVGVGGNPKWKVSALQSHHSRTMFWMQNFEVWVPISENGVERKTHASLDIKEDSGIP